jgi:histidinol-phosphate aminotransferase/imidazoleglycerol-phosphate dehydratase/histidinol-phosphatase
VSELQDLAPLRARLAAVFGVSAEALLPVRGYAHAADIVAWSGASGEFINEAEIEWSDGRSRVEEAASGTSLIVYREIGAAYGAETPLCGALIAGPETIARFAAAVGGDYFHPLIAAETLKAVAPPRLALRDARIAAFRSERARLIEQLECAEGVRSVMAGDGRFLTILADNADAVMARAAAYEASLTRIEDGVIAVEVRDAAANVRVLSAFGAASGRAPRIGEAIRETKETRIIARVDLDRARDVRIDTGAAYFDHMLEQIAAHGGISLTLACEGDLHVDLHHTIEDCALALGQALSAALGERRGVARYGFTLPMDEAEAKVSIDLGGRPYAVFEGAFAAPLIGQYPTEMTAHVFRSLAQSMGAAIHVAVKGENDHHKTEACFKAFARALRAAIAIEGDAVPSTKGAIL